MKKFTIYISILSLFFSLIISNQNKVEAATENLSASDVTSNSVVLKASFLPPNTLINFVVSDVIKKKVPFYSASMNVTTDTSGNAQASFTGLEPNGHYSGGTRIRYDSFRVGPWLDIVYFSTTFDLANLNATIKIAQDKHDKAIEGDDLGQYKYGSKRNLQIAITEADLVNNSKGSFASAKQVDIDRIIVKLQNAINDFESNKILVKKVMPKSTPINNSGPITNVKQYFDLSYKGGGVVPECPETGCGFPELIMLINNIIQFLLFVIATPLAAIAIAYAGFLYLFSGGSSENVSKAKSIIKNVLIGYVIALASWLIVHTILVGFGANEGILKYFKG